jgi:hypothetical protein
MQEATIFVEYGPCASIEEVFDDAVRLATLLSAVIAFKGNDSEYHVFRQGMVLEQRMNSRRSRTATRQSDGVWKWTEPTIA